MFYVNLTFYFMQTSTKLIDTAAPVADRLAYIYTVSWPPAWELRRMAADRYRKLGVVRSALDLYEQLELWDDIIEYVSAESSAKVNCTHSFD